MKERAIKIEGFTADARPDDKPTVCVFGEENTGKTRFACTAPCGNGVIGYLALDKNSKRTIERYKEKNPDAHILVNARPFLTDKESIALAMKDSSITEDLKIIKKTYGDAVQRVLEAGMKLADNPDVESIALDTNSQFFDWILFSHFGRRNQIESFMRGAPNQDMIDFIGAMRTKNLALVSRAAEIWKDTGQMDDKGRKKQEPSGKFKPDGFGKLGYFVTATIELTSKRRLPADASLEDKYQVRVHTCKGNTLLEGQDLHDYGVSGEGITWENLMLAIGVQT